MRPFIVPDEYLIIGISQSAADNGTHKMISAVRHDDVPKILAEYLRAVALEMRPKPDSMHQSDNFYRGQAQGHEDGFARLWYLADTLSGTTVDVPDPYSDLRRE